MYNTQYLFGWELASDNVTSQEGNKHNDFSHKKVHMKITEDLTELNLPLIKK
jgi:hypothetical protein